jgi:ABC-2 type transport system ATP-binding protein
MRGLLKQYADRGGTVLLSSHLLHEVEQIADEMVLIGGGRILAMGDRRSLLAGRSVGTLVAALDVDSLAAALAAAGIAAQRAGDGLRVQAEPVAVGRVAAEKQIVLTDLRGATDTLENLFLELTADTQRDTVAPGQSSAGPPAPSTTPSSTQSSTPSSQEVSA